MNLGYYARGAISSEAARRRMWLTGVTPSGHRLWDRAETANLVGNHPDYRAAMALNVNRTAPAHYAKAGRLRITKPRAGAWSENELLRLHRLFPRASKPEILKALPSRTWAAICRRANADGYYRVPLPRKPTGNTLLDQILSRARDRNWSLRELDSAVRSAGYFSFRRWRGGTWDHGAHSRAVVFLGGVLRARWPDPMVVPQ